MSWRWRKPVQYNDQVIASRSPSGIAEKLTERGISLLQGYADVAKILTMAGEQLNIDRKWGFICHGDYIAQAISISTKSSAQDPERRFLIKLAPQEGSISFVAYATGPKDAVLLVQEERKPTGSISPCVIFRTSPTPMSIDEMRRYADMIAGKISPHPREAQSPLPAIHTRMHTA